MEEASEYDVVGVRLNPGVVSILCLILAFFLTSLAPYAHWLWVKGYGFWVELGRWTAICSALLGLVLGGMTWRRGHRTMGALGFFGNGLVLALLGLFVFLFNWILGR